MPVLAQHGYGKGEKIHDAISAGHVQGAVLSPRYESPAQIEALVRSLREASVDREPVIVIDPQMYVSVVQGANDGKLREYPYYTPGLTRSDYARPTRLAAIVRDALEFQQSAEVSALVSPTVPFYTFQDQWCMVSLSMANEAVSIRPPGLQLWVSIVLDEACLSDSDGLAQFLDDIALLECDGFYVILNRHQPGHVGYLQAAPLANFMYMANALHEFADRDVTVAYSDLLGLALVAAGATHLATGWFANLKQFSMDRFEPSGPRRQPKKRYTSLPLLSSISLDPELQAIYDLGELDAVLSLTRYDAELRHGPAGAPWTADSACLHNWECLSRACAQLSDRPVSERLVQLETWAQDASALYGRLRQVPFEANSSPRHLGEWLDAVQQLRGPSDCSLL